MNKLGTLKENQRLALISERLDSVQSQFNLSQEGHNDPISMVLVYKDPGDREVAAFVAAVFSYGNVPQIQKTLGTIFEILGPTPVQNLKNSDGNHWKKVIPTQFKHRFNDAKDLGCLLTWLGQALRSHKSLEDFFLACQPSPNIEDIGVALENFIDGLTAFDGRPFKPAKTKGVHFFLTRPSNKSACKRLLLFLRWVVGTGPMDLALWTKIRKDILLIPVDTHVLRISKHLGFTKRKDNSWKTAQEITSQLKLLDAKDPTRYDFALCHIGISKECPSRFNKIVCTRCRMNDLCLTYARRG